jgi:hypothetical protein
MKKYSYLIIIVLISSLVLTGCLLSNISQVPATEQSGIAYLTKHTEGGPFFTDLIADGRDLAINVGDVLVWNDRNTLYVKYVVTAPWCLTETHLHVFLNDVEYTDVPQKNGNPIPGKLFQIKEDGNADAGCDADDSPETCLTAITYTIPLDWVPDIELFIAAHAVVQNDSVIIDGDVEPPIYWTESAWADGEEFVVGKNWATYFEYTVQEVGVLELYQKDPVTWEKVQGGAEGQLIYNLSGSTFDFVFNGHDLDEGVDFTLINFKSWSVVICLGSGIADEYGDVHIADSVNTGDLPVVADEKYPDGAKIWLVLTSNVDCFNKKMISWNPTEWLFENNLITFDDIDVP